MATINRPILRNTGVNDIAVPSVKEETSAPDILFLWEPSSGIITTQGEIIDSVSNVSAEPYNITRQFIKLLQSFQSQIRKRKDIDEFEYTEAMKLSANTLLQSYPEKISFQLTEDNSIFYTVIKNGITLYFEHFPMANLHELDEAVISVYEDKKNLFQTSGEIFDVINLANKVLINHKFTLPAFA